MTRLDLATRAWETSTPLGRRRLLDAVGPLASEFGVNVREINALVPLDELPSALQGILISGATPDGIFPLRWGGGQ